MKRFFLSLCFAMAFGHAGMACTLAPKPLFDFNHRISYGKNCSFRNGDAFVPVTKGESTELQLFEDEVWGAEVIDLGGGKVAQKVSSAAICMTAESVLFVDCTTADSVGIIGMSDPAYGNVDDVPFASYHAKFLQPPHGPIRFTSEATVERLVALAKRNNIHFFEDIAPRNGAVKKRDRVDIYCGCKLYYPDSAGATQ